MSAPDATPDASPEERYGARLALLAAAVAVLALVLEVRTVAVAAAATTGLAAALGLRRAVDEHVPTRTAGRVVASLGLLGGVAAVEAGVVLASASAVAAAALATAVWVAVVGVVGAADGIDVRRPLRTTAWTTTVAGLLVGVAAIVGVGNLLAGSPPPAGAAVPWAIARWLVVGGSPEAAIPAMLASAGLVCGAAAVALTITPWHAVLSPRAHVETVERLEATADALLKVSAGLFAVALLAFVVPIWPPFTGPLALVEWAFRVFALFVTALLLLVAVAVVLVDSRYDDSERSVRDAASTALAGLLVAAVLVGTVSVAATRVPLEPAVALGIAAIAAVVAVPVVEAVLAIGSGSRAVRRRTYAIPSVALVVGALGAASAGAFVAPVLTVAAALVVWDALGYRRSLQRELRDPDAVDLERRHLGATLGVVAVGVVLALLVERAAALLGPRLGGEPLVVVVGGVLLLAAITAVVGHQRPT